jgi:hypothetical protein
MEENKFKGWAERGKYENLRNIEGETTALMRHQNMFSIIFFFFNHFIKKGNRQGNCRASFTLPIFY